MKGRYFSSDEEVIATAATWLDGQPSDFFLSCLQKLEQRAKKCIELRGEYVEQIQSFGRCSLFPSWSGLGLISTPSQIVIILSKKLKVS